MSETTMAIIYLAFWVLFGAALWFIIGFIVNRKSNVDTTEELDIPFDTKNICVSDEVTKKLESQFSNLREKLLAINAAFPTAAEAADKMVEFSQQFKAGIFTTKTVNYPIEILRSDSNEQTNNEEVKKFEETLLQRIDKHFNDRVAFVMDTRKTLEENVKDDCKLQQDSISPHPLWQYIFLWQYKMREFYTDLPGCQEANILKVYHLHPSAWCHYAKLAIESGRDDYFHQFCLCDGCKLYNIGRVEKQPWKNKYFFTYKDSKVTHAEAMKVIHSIGKVLLLSEEAKNLTLKKVTQ